MSYNSMSRCKMKQLRKVELQPLELHEKMLDELPKLREELITTLQGIEQRVNAVNPSRPMIQTLHGPT
jgi:hypothetical protein